MKKVFIFDLDGTLTESRVPIAKDTADLLSRLFEEKIVAVISGAVFSRFEVQFLSGFRSTANFEHLFLLPTSGAELRKYTNGAWKIVYQEKIPDDIRAKVIYEIAKLADISRGEERKFIDDRVGQVTYAGLGIEAPLEEKKKYDPDEKKRRDFIAKIAPLFSELSFHMGGLSSIDITPRGVDKAFGVKKLLEHVGADLSEALFVGDALYKGGNDEAAKASGVDILATSGPEETKKIILEFLKQNEK